MSKRDLFVENLKRKLDGWNAELDRLEVKADAMDAQSRERYRATVQEVKEQVQQLENKYLVLKNSTADAWKDLKSGFELAWQDFEAGAKSALKKVTGKNY